MACRECSINVAGCHRFTENKEPLQQESEQKLLHEMSHEHPVNAVFLHPVDWKKNDSFFLRT